MIDVSEVVERIATRIARDGVWTRAATDYATFGTDQNPGAANMFVLDSPSSVDTHKLRSRPDTGAHLQTAVMVKLAIGLEPTDQVPAAAAGLASEAAVRNALLDRSDDWPGQLALSIDRYDRVSSGSLRIVTLTCRVLHVAPLS
jgi:hypothetical protein